MLQVHPLGRCNLSCLHCYSSSGPAVTEELETGLLLGAIQDAAQEGYNVLAVSGGEPLLYRELSQLIECARNLGMTATVTTNGTLLNARRLKSLRGLDLLAISLDGTPDSHDRMRGRGSFLQMARRLEQVRAAGLPFGFIFTLTMQNLSELEWIARFALDQGAALLQVHPLELAGRGRQMSEHRPDEEELQWAVVEAARLQTVVGPSVVIHVDALPAGGLRDIGDCEYQSLPFAFLLHPLIIESDGTVVPAEHGFDRRWKLGSLYDRSLAVSIQQFRAERLGAFRKQIVAGALTDAAAAGVRFVNWHEALTRRAREVAVSAPNA